MIRPLSLALLAAACSTSPARAPKSVPTPSAAEAPELRLASVGVPRLAPPGRAAAAERFVRPTPDAGGEGAPLVEPSETRAVALLYHAFDVGPDPLGLSSRRFAAHLDRLDAEGVSIVPLSALIDFLAGNRRLPARVAVITIDDAHRSVYEKAYPILRQRRVPFALGLPTAHVETPRAPTLAWSQIREMLGSGLCELASHGHHHRRLDVLDEATAREELELSRELIVRHTGKAPIAYFYPLGATGGRAEQRAASAGYHAAFGATGGSIALGAFSRFSVPRTTVRHGDDANRIAWLFSPKFLEQLPLRARELGSTGKVLEDKIAIWK